MVEPLFGGLTGSGTSSTWSADFRDVVREPRVDLPCISNQPTQVSATAWNRSTEMDMALRHVINMFFVNLDSLVTNLYLYRSSEDELLKWKLLVQ